MFLIGKYELSNININIERLWYGFYCELGDFVFLFDDSLENI